MTDPTVLKVSPNKTGASAHLILTPTAAANGELPALFLRAYPAKLGDNYAPITFPTNAGRDWFSLPAQNGPKDIALDVGNITVPGTYEGRVEASLQPGRPAVASTAIQIVHLSPNFAPVIAGDVVKNGEIEFSPTASNSTLILSIENPVTSPRRAFTVTIEPQMNRRHVKHQQSILSLNPDHFQLNPGQEQPILVMPGKDLPTGATLGLLTIADSDDPSMVRKVVVRINNAVGIWLRTGLIALIVFLGALLSVLLNNIFPVTVARRRNNAVLASAESDIRACTNASESVQSALLAEIDRLRLLNSQLRWYQSTKAEQTQQIDKLIASLNDAAGFANDISRLRQQVEQQSNLTVRSAVNIEEKLSEAEDALLDSRVDAAKASLEKARQIRVADTSETTLAVLRRDLEAEINELSARSEATPRSNRPQYITDRLNELRDIVPQLATAPVARLLKAERDYNIVDRFMNFESAVARNPNIGTFKDTFLGYLRTDAADPKVALFSALIQHELAPDDVAKAITKKEGSIKGDDNVPINRLVEYSFQFTDLRLESAAAARRVLDYKWDFGDSQPTASYERCKHVFVHKRKRLLEGLKSQLEGLVSKSADKAPSLSPAANQTWSPTIKLVVTPIFDRAIADVRAIAEPFSKTITLRPAETRGRGAIGIQVFTFVITFLTATAASFAAQYGTIPDLNVPSTWITGFLFGFSLDQIRDRTTMPTTTHT